MTPIKRSLSGLGMSLVELIIGILLLINPVGFTSGIIVTLGIGTVLVKCDVKDILSLAVRELLDALAGGGDVDVALALAVVEHQQNDDTVGVFAVEGLIIHIRVILRRTGMREARAV